MLGNAFPPVEDQIRRYFADTPHPYAHLRRTLEIMVEPTSRVLEIGCGRSAPLLQELKGRALHLAGIDVVDFTVRDPALSLHKNSADNMASIATGSVDIAYSRSVMEHLQNAGTVFQEIHRVLKPGGSYVFITPSIYDYASVISMLVPNRFHARIVRLTEGRDEHDTFPAYYKSNSRRRIKRLADSVGLETVRLDYLGQYPSYLSFSRVLFRLGCMYEKLISLHPRTHFLRGWIFAHLRKNGSIEPRASAQS